MVAFRFGGDRVVIVALELDAVVDVAMTAGVTAVLAVQPLLGDTGGGPFAPPAWRPSR